MTVSFRRFLLSADGLPLPGVAGIEKAAPAKALPLVFPMTKRVSGASLEISSLCGEEHRDAHAEREDTTSDDPNASQNLPLHPQKFFQPLGHQSGEHDDIAQARLRQSCHLVGNE